MNAIISYLVNVLIWLILLNLTRCLAIFKSVISCIYTMLPNIKQFCYQKAFPLLWWSYIIKRPHLSQTKRETSKLFQILKKINKLHIIFRNHSLEGPGSGSAFSRLWTSLVMVITFFSKNLFVFFNFALVLNEFQIFNLVLVLLLELQHYLAQV